VIVVIPSHNEENIHKVVEKVEREIQPSKIIISNDRYGKGKGWAVRQGINLVNKKGLCVIIDGDGDIDPEEIHKLLPYIYEYDAIIGRKRIRDLPLKRKVVSLISRFVIKLMFRIPTGDTQTGLKIYWNPPDFQTDGFAYDVEMLRKCKRIKEVFINVTISKGASKIWKTVKELICLWFQR